MFINNIDEIKTGIINALKNTYRTYKLKESGLRNRLPKFAKRKTVFIKKN